MRLADLSLIDGRGTLRIEKRTELVRVGCLHSLVFPEANEKLVFVSDVEIKPTGQQILMSEAAGIGAEAHGTGLRRAQTRTYRTNPSIATGCIKLWIPGNSLLRSRSVVPECEHLLVERNRRAETG